MKFRIFAIGLIITTIMGFSVELKTKNNLRVGAVQIEDEMGKKNTTFALGGFLGAETETIKGFSLGATFYTTNALFGKDEEAMFLSSTNDSYSILGEAFIKAQFGKTTIKAGRQIVDTPYADSDDVGMVPNSFEGYTLVTKDIKDMTIILASLNRWAGVDSEQPEDFNRMQDDMVLTGGVIYEGIKNGTIQIWHYKLDDVDFTYFEIGYENNIFSVAGQYSDQDNSNTVFGLSGEINFGDLRFSTAYNKVDGMVTNGFGGGPFFTSSEDHTIADVKDQKAWLVGTEYGYQNFKGGITYVNFDKGEDETDYILSYIFNDDFTIDIIYSDMYNDGKMTRIFANYSF